MAIPKAAAGRLWLWNAHTSGGQALTQAGSTTG